MSPAPSCSPRSQHQLEGWPKCGFWPPVTRGTPMMPFLRPGSHLRLSFHPPTIVCTPFAILRTQTRSPENRSRREKRPGSPWWASQKHSHLWPEAQQHTAKCQKTKYQFSYSSDAPTCPHGPRRTGPSSLCLCWPLHVSLVRLPACPPRTLWLSESRRHVGGPLICNAPALLLLAPTAPPCPMRHRGV